MKPLLLSAFFLFATTLLAQPHLNSAVYNGMAGSGSTFSSHNAVLLNPALSPTFEKQSIGLGTSVPYNISNLTNFYTYGSFQTNIGWLGFHIDFNGQGNFNETGLHLNYALPLFQNFYGFVEAAYWFSPVKEDGFSLSGATTKIGVTWIIDNFILSGQILNPISAQPTDFDPNNFKQGSILGIGYDYEEMLWLGADLYFIENNAPEIRLGIDLLVVENFHLRGGFTTKEDVNIWAMGFGLNLKKHTLDLTYQSHSVLGGTPEIAFSYVF